MYTTRVPRPREIRARHAVANQWDLLNALGIRTPDAVDAPTEMTVDAGARQRVDSRLASAGAGGDAELIVIHVSAGNAFRRWPQESFASLIVRLLGGRPQRHVLIVSGPSERDAAANVTQLARERGPEVAARVLAPMEFTLAELRALMDRAALFIGGDSGPMHIASTSAVPIAGIYGPTLPVRSEPWRGPKAPSEAAEVDGLECRPCDQRVCVHGDFRCLTWLAPEQVLEAAERALARRS